MIMHINRWYMNEYEFTKHNILLHNDAGAPVVIIDNQLLDEERKEGLFLHLDSIIAKDKHGERQPLRRMSTAQVFTPTPDFVERMGASSFNGVAPQVIGTSLRSDMFHFQRSQADLQGILFGRNLPWQMRPWLTRVGRGARGHL